MARLVVVVALVALVGCKGSSPNRQADQQQAASLPPEPKRLGEPTLRHEMRSSRVKVVAYIDKWLATGGYPKAEEQLEGVEAILYSTKNVGGDHIAIDFETGMKVTPGQEKQVLENLVVGRAVELVQEVDAVEDLYSRQEGWERGRQYGGDVNRIDVVRMPGDWWLTHHRYKLSPEWIDWKARQYVGRCDQYCNPLSKRRWRHKVPGDCERVWYRCLSLTGDQANPD